MKQIAKSGYGEITPSPSIDGNCRTSGFIPRLSIDRGSSNCDHEREAGRFQGAKLVEYMNTPPLDVNLAGKKGTNYLLPPPAKTAQTSLRCKCRGHVFPAIPFLKSVHGAMGNRNPFLVDFDTMYLLCCKQMTNKDNNEVYLLPLFSREAWDRTRQEVTDRDSSVLCYGSDKHSHVLLTMRTCFIVRTVTFH